MSSLSDKPNSLSFFTDVLDQPSWHVCNRHVLFHIVILLCYGYCTTEDIVSTIISERSNTLFVLTIHDGFTKDVLSTASYLHKW